MRALLSILFLIGWVATTEAELPTALVGQWVGPGFKPAANEDAEPSGANIVYLLRNGHAVIWGTEIGVPCVASYGAANHTLILKTVRVDKNDPEKPTIARFTYDPRAKTLKCISAKAPDEPTHHSTEIYRWRKVYVPAFVREAWGEP